MKIFFILSFLVAVLFISGCAQSNEIQTNNETETNTDSDSSKYDEYIGKACESHQECGGLPCFENQCLVQECTSNDQCPNGVLCGLNLTPTPGFCATVDVI